ncbi:MAG: NAD(P)-dependent alcohol dehydrogenase [Candidatus Nanopelagicales bacterium]
MRTVNAYATTSAGAPFEPTTIERRDLGPTDVLIAIQYTGICHSDVHAARGEWGPTNYPFVAGHEIAGVVEEVGPEVTRYAVGDRVGVGCLVDSCGSCRHCLAGNEQFCDDSVGTYGSTGRDGKPTHGGYSTHIVVKEGFVVRIPDGLDLDVAAPLLCAGITTYSPLRHWDAGPGTRVGVLGLGGLGHAAVKFARALGADVSVFSRTLAKADDAVRMGASGVYATSDPSTFEERAGSLDLIINTVSAPIDLRSHLSLLDVDGVMVQVGAPPEPLRLPMFSLIGSRKSLAGSMIGGIAETQEMLDLAAEHGFGADIETIDASGITAAHDRVVAGDVRYRFVIDIASMR